MRVLGRIAASIGAIALGMAVVVLGLIGLGGGLLVLVPLAIGVVVLLQYRRARTMEIGWSGSGALVTAVPAPGLTTEPVAGTRRGRFGVAGSLARVEARELVVSPWFHVGIALWLVILVMFGWFFVDDIDRSWIEFFGMSTLMCHPLAAFTIVAAHRNRTRSRRDGCDEMFDACPADANARTLGHLATAWIPSVMQVVFVLLLATLIATRNQHIYGPWGGYVLAAVLACAVLGAGSVALGVTLGRWAPWGLVPFVAVAAVGIASGNINNIGQPAFATDRLLATLVATTGVDPLFIPWLWWERLAWLAAISTVVAAIGLLGGRTTRVAATVLAAAAVGALVSALLIVRPATGEADRIVDLVADPLAHSSCRPAGPQVEVCAYDGYEGLVADTVAALEPVTAAVPAGVLREVVFLTFYERGVEDLTAETQSALEGRTMAVPDGALRLRYNAHPENFEAARLRLAARAVGLPTERGGGSSQWLIGQARGVIVLWLAGQGLDADRREALVAPGGLGYANDPAASNAVWPALCHEEDAVLQWSPTDLDATRALFALPDDHVRRVLHERWAELTAPDVATDDLLIAVGAEPLGSPLPIPPQDTTCV